MTETITLGDIRIRLQRKAIKNSHLSVHPPAGTVTLTVPVSMRTDVARAYAISKLGWIKKQRRLLLEQPREGRREYSSRESHFIWGHRRLLRVVEADVKPSVVLDHKYLTLTVRPDADREKRVEVFRRWEREQLHAVIPAMISKWEAKLGVKVRGYFLQRMKTKWGSCNPKAQTLRINTELVKKPRDLLEYVIVHEMAHILVPNHKGPFVAIMNKHYPTWENARAELNALPLPEV
jgi:predicted metal-dependent hydrolase